MASTTNEETVDRPSKGVIPDEQLDCKEDASLDETNHSLQTSLTEKEPKSRADALPLTTVNPIGGDSKIPPPLQSEDGEEGQAPLPPPIYHVYPLWKKRTLVLGAAITAFFSPLSAQIYLPALPSISKDLNISDSQTNLTITTYMIFQGLVPMIFGSLADSGGRRPAYIVCFVIYIGANIGLALAPSYGAILGLRCLQSAGSSSTVALCTAVVADVVTSAERGQYVGFTVVPVVLAPALGPVIGGLISQSLGWRWIFWFLAIIAGATLALLVVFFPETCRRIVHDGSVLPPPIYRTVWQALKLRKMKKARRNDLERQSTNASAAEGGKFKFEAPNVLGSIVLLFEKETSHVLAASSIIFAGFYCIATAMPSQLSSIYGYNEIEVGLMYLPLAAGSVITAVVVGPLINRNYRRHAEKLGIAVDSSRQADLAKFPIERARLEVALPLLGLGAASLLAWGWAMESKTSAAAPGILSALVGVGMTGYSNATNILLVDIHPGKAGTVTASNNIARCLVGAGASAAIVPMINAMGIGWAFTLVAGFYLLCVPSLLLVQARGMRWRAEKKEKEEAKRLKREAKNAQQEDKEHS